MYVLYLNMMRGRCEDIQAVARAESEQALLDLMERERLPEPIKDEEGFVHTFRDGLLYWYNPPTSPNFGAGIGDAGNEDSHAEVARRRFQEFRQSLYCAD